MFPEDVRYIVVHCSATPPSRDIGVHELRVMHTSKPREWSDVGYHIIIRRNGQKEIGRQLNVQAAHVKGKNHESYGVCLIGGVDEDNKPECNFTEQQFKTLKEELDRLTHIAFNAIVCGHRDMSPDLNNDGKIGQPEWMKECPCFNAGLFYGH